MQYFREDKAGNRISVPEYEYLIDKRSASYKQIHAYGVMIVYQLV